LREGPRAPGIVPGMGLARGDSAMVSGNDDGVLRARGRYAAAGVLPHDDGAAEHRLTAVVGAGQSGRRAPMFVVATGSGCRGRIAPGFAQHAGIRPSHHCQDDREDSRSKHGMLVQLRARAAPVVRRSVPSVGGLSGEGALAGCATLRNSADEVPKIPQLNRSAPGQTATRCEADMRPRTCLEPLLAEPIGRGPSGTSEPPQVRLLATTLA
jgi:hypothetical protein